MRKPPVGFVVYLKRNAAVPLSRMNAPRTVVEHVTKKSGNTVARLDTGELVEFGKLTDIPCSKMVCGKCKWHRKEDDNG